MSIESKSGEFRKKNELSLRIIPNGSKALSKNQVQFNKLTAKIENLESQFEREAETLGKLLSLYSDEIQPILLKRAKLQFQLAKTLDVVANRFKFSRKQLIECGDVIVGLCRNAFQEFEPDKEQEAMFNKWSDVSYSDEIENEKDIIKDELADFVSNAFGMEIDPDDFDASPEGFAKLQDEVKRKIEENEARQQTKRPGKSKRILNTESARQTEEKLKNTTLRSIYIALAKILHPDVEPDPALKAEKEALMKQVTAAYDQKNLAALLKLELEWVHKTSDSLEQLADNKLRIYISALKQRVNELQHQIELQRFHPRFIKIREYTGIPEKYAFNEIRLEKLELNRNNKELKESINYLEKSDSKKDILRLIDNMYVEEDDDLFWDFMQDFDFSGNTKGRF
jgi:hypothetical protein